MYTNEQLIKEPFFEEILKNTNIDYMLDALTNVIARKYIILYIQYLIKQQTPFYIMLLDIDNFKEINDDYGHFAGDKLLANVSKRISDYLDGRGFVGRYGGDEFIVVMRESNEDLSELCSGLYYSGGAFRRRYKIDDNNLYITSSIGVSVYPNDGDDFETIFRNIDHALYYIKRNGRNGFSLYNSLIDKQYSKALFPKKSLHLVIAGIANIMDKDESIDDKIKDILLYTMSEMGVTDSFYIGENKKAISINDLQGITKLEDLSSILRVDGLFYCNDLEYIKKKNKSLYEFCVNNNLLSILVAQLRYRNNIIGYIGFADSKSERMWQEEEFTLILNIVNAISLSHQSIKLLSKELFIQASDKCLDNPLFSALEKTSPNKYYFITNMDTDNTRISRNALEIFGLKGEYIHNFEDLFTSLVHPDDFKSTIELFKEFYTKNISLFNKDCRLKSANGKYITCSCRIVASEDPITHTKVLIGTIENHSIPKLFDHVTNLYNMTNFTISFNDVINNKSNKNVTLVLIGLCDFSDINSLYGYSQGDYILKTIGEIIIRILDLKGIVYKLDGVRFGIYFINVDLNIIEQKIKLIKKELTHNLYINEAQVCISCGVSVVENCENSSFQEVLTGANSSLISSKYDKRGNVVYFNKSKSTENEKNLHMLSELRKSIYDNFNGYYLVFQPILNAQTEEVIAAETLLRWHSDRYGIVSPAFFVPWLENDSSFFELGDWIICNALKAARPILDKNPKFQLYLNISYSQFSHPNFINSLTKAMDEADFPGKNITLELTERCRLLYKNQLKEQIKKCKDLGMMIAVDDFGTGYSSLDLLADIEADIIKIDKGFLENLSEKKINYVIAEGVTEFASKLNLKVCFEGVETKELSEIVKSFKPYSIQGFYYSLPIYMEEMIKKYFNN